MKQKKGLADIDVLILGFYHINLPRKEKHLQTM